MASISAYLSFPDLDPANIHTVKGLFFKIVFPIDFYFKVFVKNYSILKC